MLIGIDVGGTFTDIIAYHDGRLYRKKIPTTYNQEEGIIKGINQILDDIKQKFEIKAINHGSTVATNAVIERKGAKVGLITTKGFRDVLEIGRQTRTSLYDLKVRREQPLVERACRVEVEERISRDGIIKPMDMKSLEEAVNKLIENNVESIAVSLLFSFLNPKHEREIKHYIKEKMNVPVSISSDINPIYREYERTSTTVLNAYVSPALGSYLFKLENLLQKRKIKARLNVIKSDGGLMSSKLSREFGVYALLSGPAGGVIGSNFIGKISGHSNLITFDMGGTSCDVSVIQDNMPKIRTEGEVAGYPMTIPMIDIVTVGAGGGSIAWVDEGGSLRVGPKSAGSIPGPACYGRGGNEPTVTDSHLVLRHIDPDYFLGGEMKVFLNLAESSMKKIQEKLKLNKYEVSSGILEVVNSNMLRALRLVTVERGLDPRDFSLISFGGAGPLHAFYLAKELEIERIIVPDMASVLSALGCLFAEFSFESMQTYLIPLEKFELETSESIFQSLEHNVVDKLVKEGVAKDEILLVRNLDMRYQGQSYELTIPYSTHLKNDFEKEHMKSYGFILENPIEIVNFRVKGITLPREISLLYQWGKEDPFIGERKVWIDQWQEIPVFRKENIEPGWRERAPLLIECKDTNILVPEGKIEMDRYGTLFINTG